MSQRSTRYRRSRASPQNRSASRSTVLPADPGVEKPFNTRSIPATSRLGLGRQPGTALGPDLVGKLLTGAVMAAACVWLAAAPDAVARGKLTAVGKAKLVGPVATCVTRRWIGVRSAALGACPAAAAGAGGEWLETELFAEAGVPPAALSRFCLYEWFPAETAPDDSVLPGAPDVVDLAPDCARVSTQASAVSQITAPALERALLDRLDAPVPSAIGPSSLAPVRVAVVDTAPEWATQPNSPHGPAMAAIVRRTGCDNPIGCALDVRASLGLPMIDDATTDPDNGGYYGTLGQLAAGIAEATLTWENDAAAAGGAFPLVIGLSAGWARYGGPNHTLPVQHMPLVPNHPNGISGVAGPVRAVHSAIAHAVCNGALVLSAAGNDPVGAGLVAGPLLPAAWETRSGPDDTDCSAFGVTGGGVGSNVPFVHAIGGVDLLDADLPNTRSGAQPRLAAPSFHATVIESGAAPHGVYSGTSVATAAAAAAAALVWSHRPELSAAAVADTLHGGGIAIGGSADFCLGGDPCDAVHRLSVCGALAAACQGSTTACGSTPVCNTPPAADPSTNQQLLVDIAAYADDLAPLFPPAVVYFASGLDELTTEAMCADYLLADDIAELEPLCQTHQLPPAAAHPDVAPQPEDPMCPVCLFSADKLVVSIDTAVPGGVLYNPTLTLGMSSGDTVVYALGQIPGFGALFAGQQAIIQGLSTGPMVPKSGWLTYKVVESGKSYVTGNPVLIY